MTTALTLTAHDPLVARDGRPFGAGQGTRMKGLPWPYPSVVAGSLRTAFGKAAGIDFDKSAADLLKVEVAGVFPARDGTLYLPAPADCVVHPDNGPLRARPDEPRDDGEGCDFPAAGLRPVVLPAEVNDFKPKEPPAWWPADKLADWLTGKPVTFDGSFLLAPRTEVRDHVQLDADTGAAAESRLFATAGLPVTHLPRYGASDGDPFAKRYAPITLAARVNGDGWPELPPLDTWHPLGGERRLVHWASGGDPRPWNCPPTVTAALAGAKKVRMVLATPAVFGRGWRPGWVDEHTLTGSPPGCPVVLKLVGLTIGRWRAVSGWSLAPPRGPKAIKRLVPAGGVYFFDVVGRDAGELAGRWLESVSDAEQDRRDGFGLAVWGTWGDERGGTS